MEIICIFTLARAFILKAIINQLRRSLSLAVMQCDVRALRCRHDAGDARRLDSELHTEDFCFPSRTQRRWDAAGECESPRSLYLTCLSC